MRIHDAPVVLLIESDPVVALDLSDALTQAGYGVVGPVETGTEALHLLHGGQPSLAVVDGGLAEGDCASLTRALRQHSVPFLIHTANCQDPNAAAAFAGVPCLARPALPEDVVALCDELSLTDPGALFEHSSGRLAPTRDQA